MLPGTWSYQCNWQPSDNPNHLNYPSGLFCAPYQNPDIGGIRNFDNILFAWIQVFQHMVMQDWWVQVWTGGGYKCGLLGMNVDWSGEGARWVQFPPHFLREGCIVPGIVILGMGQF